jgi:hypothetical protein
MDICMFTPEERKEVETLVGNYERERAALQNHLEKLLCDWGEEIVQDDTDKRSDFMVDQVVYRYDRVGRWICQLIEGKIELEEIDKVMTFDDDDE